jgi:hypothetical protein
MVGVWNLFDRTSRDEAINKSVLVRTVKVCMAQRRRRSGVHALVEAILRLSPAASASHLRSANLARQDTILVSNGLHNWAPKRGEAGLCCPSMRTLSLSSPYRFDNCLHARRRGQQRPRRRSPTGGMALGAGDWRRRVGSRRTRLTGGATSGAGRRGWPSAWRGEEDRQHGGGGSRSMARRG